jgi:hypothetical protein
MLIPYRIVGHVHQGATQLQVALNGDPTCISTAGYLKSTSSSNGMGGMGGMGGSASGEVLDNMSICTPFKQVKIGDKLQVSVDYDLVTHPL